MKVIPQANVKNEASLAPSWMDRRNQEVATYVSVPSPAPEGGDSGDVPLSRRIMNSLKVAYTRVSRSSTVAKPANIKVGVVEQPDGAPSAESSRMRHRRQSVWLREEQRCKYTKVLIDFFNAYSMLPNAQWSNQIVRVDLSDTGTWAEHVTVPHIKAPLLFVVAENDEMEMCNKDVQYETFKRATAAVEPKKFVQIPCELGGHAGMMDSNGLVGHKHTWTRMIEETQSFLSAVLN